MKFIFCLAVIVTFFISGAASEHGIYLQTLSNIDMPVSSVKDLIKEKLANSGFKVDADLDIKTPDYVREK